MATRANTQVQDNIVSLAPNTDISMNGTFTLAAAGVITATTAADGAADAELEIGDIIVSGVNVGIVTAVTNNSSFVATTNAGSLIGTSGDTTVSLARKKRSAFEEPSSHMMGVITVSLSAPTTVSGTNSHFTKQIHIGDIIMV